MRTIIVIGVLLAGGCDRGVENALPPSAPDPDAPTLSQLHSNYQFHTDTNTDEPMVADGGSETVPEDSSHPRHTFVCRTIDHTNMGRVTLFPVNGVGIFFDAWMQKTDNEEEYCGFAIHTEGKCAAFYYVVKYGDESDT